MPPLHGPATSTADAADRWAGWAIFGAIMLCVEGSVNAM
jgi:hypothetical protein